MFPLPSHLKSELNGKADYIMAFNDFVLVDGIIDDMFNREGKSKTDNKVRGAVFERLAISELLKTYASAVPVLIVPLPHACP